MNKLIFSLMILSSLSLYAQEEMVPETNPGSDEDLAALEKSADKADKPSEEFIPPAKTQSNPELVNETKIDSDERYYERKSRWVSTFGFENLKYETNFKFNGKRDFKPDTQEMWGARIGFGGEIYFGAGFVTRSMVEGYYAGTMFSRVLNGGEKDDDIKFAFTKKTGQILGLDASQSLGWMFDFKAKNPFMQTVSYMTLEPFVEAGFGYANAQNRLSYSYKLDGTNEAYKLKVQDDLLNARVGAGLNLASSKGFFLTLKATVNRYEITQRKEKGSIKENGIPSRDISDTPKNAKIDPIVIYQLGGGYKF